MNLIKFKKNITSLRSLPKLILSLSIGFLLAVLGIIIGFNIIVYNNIVSRENNDVQAGLSIMYANIENDLDFYLKSTSWVSYPGFDNNPTTLNEFLIVDYFINIEQRTGLQAITYVPVVTHANRPAFEAFALNQYNGTGIDTYEIKEFVDGKWIPTSVKEFYYPVLYILPINPNPASVRGFDLNTDPLRGPSYRKSRDLNMVSISSPITIIVTQQTGVIVYFPINNGKEFLGVVVTVINVDNFVSDLKNTVGTLYLYDTTDNSASPEFIYSVENEKSYYDHLSDFGLSQTNTCLDYSSGNFHIHPVTVEDHQWCIVTITDNSVDLTAFIILLVICCIWFALSIVAVGIFLSREIVKKKNIQLVADKISAETSNNIKTKFMSMISHEIRTPLNGIIGVTSLLEMSDIPEQKDNIEMLSSSSELLLKIVNEVLDWTKITSGEISIEYTFINLQELINSLQHFFSLRLKNNNSQLVSKINCNPCLQGDIVKIKQICINLIENAIKFGKKNNNIELTFDELTFDNENYEIIISVKDYGIGIEKDKLESVFNHFSQANESTTRIYGGTGLGLSIVKEYCKLMGGNAWVESKLGDYTIFFCRLVLKQIPNHKSTTLPSIHRLTEIHPDSEITKKTYNILVAEDNPVNKTIVMKFLMSLTQFDFNIDIAADGLIALDFCKNKTYDFIILDIFMPNLDGREVVKSLRSDSIYNNLKTYVVAHSANITNELTGEYLSLGFNNILFKPVKFNTFREFVEDSIEIIERSK